MDISQGLTAQWAQLRGNLKKLRDTFRTSKDVYTDLIGIDIDDASLLSLQLRNPIGVVNIVGAGMIKLASGVIIEDAINDKNALAADLTNMILFAKYRSKHCAIAIPGSKVLIKQFKLEKSLSVEEAEARAWQEARRAFPDIVKNVFLDFSQQVEIIPGGGKKYILSVVAARKEDVIPRLEALQSAGLTTKIVDVDYFALERAYSLFASQLPEKHAEKYVAIVNFNPHSIVLVIMHRKSAVYFTRQNYIGDALLPFVQQAMGFETPEIKIKPAEAKPITLSLELPIQLSELSPASTNPTALSEDQKSHAVLSIRRLFQSFYAEQAGHMIECIALTGRCALLPELPKHIEKTMGIPTIAANPLIAFRAADDMNAKNIIKMGPAFAVSCGLAMRGMPLWK